MLPQREDSNSPTESLEESSSLVRSQPIDIPTKKNITIRVCKDSSVTQSITVQSTDHSDCEQNILVPSSPPRRSRQASLKSFSEAPNEEVRQTMLETGRGSPSYCNLRRRDATATGSTPPSLSTSLTRDDTSIEHSNNNGISLLDLDGRMRALEIKNETTAGATIPHSAPHVNGTEPAVSASFSDMKRPVSLAARRHSTGIRLPAPRPSALSSPTRNMGTFTPDETFTPALSVVPSPERPGGSAVFLLDEETG